MSENPGTPAATPPVAPQSDYDEFVNWDKRLANEGPFFQRLFEAAGVKRVIDVGAGSARHSIMFATWGLDVVAVDPDDSMLEQARANAQKFAPQIEAGGGRLEIIEGGFGELESLGLGPADAVVCTGNALPHVDGREGLAATLEDFSAVVGAGGIAVLHLLNHDRLLKKRPRVVPPKVVETAGGTKVFVRVIDYPPGDEYLDFDFVTMARDSSGAWALASRRSPHTAIPVALLEQELKRVGFSEVDSYGGHDGHALGDNDESVIVVARKSG